MPSPSPEGWICPQEGCDKPLSAHVVSQADRLLDAGQKSQKRKKGKVGR